METSNQYGRQPGEDRQDQLIRLVGELRTCVDALKTQVGKNEAERVGDARVQAERDKNTATWRSEVRQQVDELSRGQEALRIQLAKMDRDAPVKASSAGAAQAWISAGGGAALVAYVVGKLAGVIQ